MGKLYLFSPVGNTDPIKYLYDGSMLHICRVYKPDVVYLYLSKEMWENHQKDNRYVRTLEFLGEKLGHSFEIRIIKREELVSVQRYDVFYKEFRQIIADIEKEMKPGDKLLLNMASGTPAMKSALVVLATLAEYRFTPIQVSTPKNKSNLELEERSDYDVVGNWELDEDNAPDFKNRCEEVECFNLITLLKIDMIKKHIQAYDYHAALEIAREIQDQIDPDAYRLLVAADARVNLDWDTIEKAAKKFEKLLFPVEDMEKRTVFEYALGLKLRIQRGEYADFIRAITPVVMDLLDGICFQHCGFQVNKYCEDGKPRKWSKEKLRGTDADKILQSGYGGNFRYDVVYSTHLDKIIQKKCRDEEIKKGVKDLTSVERQIRNLAAHEIVSITDKKIKKETGKSAGEIMRIIQMLCAKIQINENRENWNSYDMMNRQIIKKLEPGM